jgi:hypothetical protein
VDKIFLQQTEALVSCSCDEKESSGHPSNLAGKAIAYPGESLAAVAVPMARQIENFIIGERRVVLTSGMLNSKIRINQNRRANPSIRPTHVVEQIVEGRCIETDIRVNQHSVVSPRMPHGKSLVRGVSKEHVAWVTNDPVTYQVGRIPARIVNHDDLVVLMTRLAKVFDHLRKVVGGVMADEHERYQWSDSDVLRANASMVAVLGSAFGSASFICLYYADEPFMNSEERRLEPNPLSIERTMGNIWRTRDLQRRSHHGLRFSDRGPASRLSAD